MQPHYPTVTDFLLSPFGFAVLASILIYAGVAAWIIASSLLGRLVGGRS